MGGRTGRPACERLLGAVGGQLSTRRVRLHHGLALLDRQQCPLGLQGHFLKYRWGLGFPDPGLSFRVVVGHPQDLDLCWACGHGTSAICSSDFPWTWVTLAGPVCPDGSCCPSLLLRVRMKRSLNSHPVTREHPRV